MFNNHKSFVASLILVLVFSLFAIVSCKPTETSADATRTSSPALAIDEKWSNTSPAINQTHIFFGEINKHGKPVGFHARPQGVDPAKARLKKRQSGPNKAGVYTARIEIYDPHSKRWREKFSSLFPDALTPKEVIKAISHAYSNRDKTKKQPWSGPSGLGFPIQGYVLRDGRINTAFPVFIKDW